MQLRHLGQGLKFLAAGAVLAGLFAGAWFVNRWVQEERAAEGSGDKVETPLRAKQGIIKLNTELARSFGIKEAPAETVSWTERVPAYGQVVPNPRATVEVRAAFGGTLRAHGKVAMPGDRVRAERSTIASIWGSCRVPISATP